MTLDFDVEIRDGKKVLMKYQGSEQNVNVPDGIEIIGDFAFAGCVSLVKVHLPTSVTEIEACVFMDCNNLTSVEMHEGVKAIGQGAFENCSSLTNLYIPSTVTEIWGSAFWRCSSLESVVIPKEAHFGEEGKTETTSYHPLELCIYYRHEPSEPSSIEGYHNLFIALLDEEYRRIGKLFILDENQDKLEEKFTSRLLSGLVKHLSEYDVLYTSINDIVIRKARAALCRLEYPLELRDDFKKMYISYLKSNAELIIPVLILQGDIANLSTLSANNAIPQNNVNRLVEEANKNSQLEIAAILLDYKNKTMGGEIHHLHEHELNDLDNEWITQENEDETLTITKYLGKNLYVTIPSVINSEKVKAINGYSIGSLILSVFSQHKNLVQSVIIEDGIAEIGERAFLECRNIKSIVIPKSVNRIDKEAFEGCPNLVIHSPKGSYAIEYAKENWIKYVET